MIHSDKLWRTIGEVLFLKNTFRQAINRIHFSETHTEREFGHMLHIENKKRHLSDDLLEGMVRVFFNDPQNLNRRKARKEHEEDTHFLRNTIPYR